MTANWGTLTQEEMPIVQVSPVPVAGGWWESILPDVEVVAWSIRDKREGIMFSEYLMSDNFEKGDSGGGGGGDNPGCTALVMLFLVFLFLMAKCNG